MVQNQQGRPYRGQASPLVEGQIAFTQAIGRRAIVTSQVAQPKTRKIYKKQAAEYIVIAHPGVDEN
jgi:hypothetical protein